MGVQTGISWTDATWNPWMGCDKVSPGCDNCYMFREQKQYGHNPEIVRRSKTKFSEPLKWQKQREHVRADLEHEAALLPFRVFTCSWSDFFHNDADQWRDEAWDIIASTPDITYQILTKRPSRIYRHLPYGWGDEGWHNVWLGVSVELQEYIRRAEILGDIPARVRFISAEPLLGPLYFDAEYSTVLAGFQWGIVGGETSSEPRWMEYEWARLVFKQWERADIKRFFKQRSGPKPGLLDGVPNDLLIHEFPDNA